MFIPVEKAKFTALYGILITVDRYVYDTTAALDAQGQRPLVADTAVTYANAVIRALAGTAVGLWWLPIPTDLPAGDYIAILRDAAVGSEAAADAIVKSVEFSWGGSKVLSAGDAQRRCTPKMNAF